MRKVAVLLQKYERIIEIFSKRINIAVDKALEIFYHWRGYRLIRDGVSDMHCMSDNYLAEELELEYKGQTFMWGKIHGYSNNDYA